MRSQQPPTRLVVTTIVLPTLALAYLESGETEAAARVTAVAISRACRDVPAPSGWRAAEHSLEEDLTLA
jgi:hypothetical protein